ncbi:MAG: ribonuclease E/G [Alphaproteobacteria bacterium]
MSTRLFVSALPGEVRAAWLTDDGLCDLVVLRDDRPSLADNIYLGRVATVQSNLGAAFVDIGADRPGFLPLDEAPKGLSEGDSLVLRVARDATAEKGARLTARYGELPPDLIAAAEGVIPPALLRQASDPLMVALNDEEPPVEIVIDDPATFARARKTFAAKPEMLARLRLDLDPAPLFERAGIEAQIEALLEPQVDLPSGGNLLIEPVRTLIAIDVNSARHDGPGTGAKAVNLEAAAEIPRQLRLRGLSGLIVVDFLELADARARERVVDTLRRGLNRDARPGRVFAMRRSGLVEITRRRAGPALYEVLTEPCGIGGSGRVHDPVSQAFAALRAARAAAAGAPGRAVTVVGAPRLIAALEGLVAPARITVEERLGRPLTLRSQTGQDGFDIVLE